jgi:hypothetical protein
MGAVVVMGSKLFGTADAAGLLDPFCGLKLGVEDEALKETNQAKS